MVIKMKLRHILALGLLGGAICSGSLLAQHKDKRSRVNVDVKERKRVKGQGIARNQLNKSAIFAIEVENKLIKGIDKTLQAYKRQIKRMQKGSNTRLTLHRRILNLYLEKAKYERSKEERVYGQRWEKWDINGRRGSEPQLSTRGSKGSWNAVAKQSGVIMREYPRSKQADEVIFIQAFALQYLGKEKQAAQIYTKLIQTYPNSNIAGEAYSSLGDFFFDKEDFRNAFSNYEKALRFKRADRYLWALFKLGWCSYNLGRNKDALKYWKQVVKLGRSRGAQGVKLREEALRDMVFAFAELKDVNGALAYYQANGGGEYVGTLLTMLAQELADDGNLAKAIQTLKLFQQKLPYSEGAPTAQKEVVSLNHEMVRYKDVWRELESLFRRYGPKSAWARRNSGNKQLLLETRQMIRDQMLYYPKLTHKKAIERDNRAQHETARHGYLLFLQSFPGAKEITEVKFNLADIEYYLKRYRRAGRQYMEIVVRGKKSAIIYQGKNKSNIHKKSAEWMVSSYAKDFEPEFEKLQKQKPNFKKPRKLSQRAVSYIKACSLYEKNYPKEMKIIRTCQLDASKIHYYSGNKKESKRYLGLIAFRYPKSKEGRNAVEFLIPLYKDGEKKELLGLADRLLKIPAYQKGELGAKLRALKRGAAIDDIATEKDSLKRAKRWENMARRDPKNKEADKMWANAGGDYLKAGAVPAAIAAYVVLVKKYPKSKQAQTAMLNVAKLYEKRLEFSAAALYFESYSRKYPKDSKAVGTHARACELLIAVDSNKANSVCMGFAKRFPKQAEPIVEKLIIGAERGRRVNQLSTLIYKSFLNKYKLSANKRIVTLYRLYRVTKGRGAVATKAAGQILAEARKSRSVEGEALRYVGEIFFRNANRGIGTYAKLKLSGGTVERLQASIEAKAKALEKQAVAYQSVINTKDAYWGVAALHQIGVIHEQLARMLESPPAINGAKAEDVKKQLAPQVKQLDTQASEFYKQGFSLVTKFQIHSDWSVKIINAMRRIDGSPIRFDDWVPTPDFLASQVSASVVESLGGR